MVYVYIKNSGKLALVTRWIDHEGITLNEMIRKKQISYDTCETYKRSHKID